MDIPLPSYSSLTSSHNTPRGTTSSNFSDSHRNTNRNSINAKSTLPNANSSYSINCIKTHTNKRALIPVIIDNDTEIQALCDPCADITVIQKSYIPSDTVIHPWTDGQFQVVDHEIKRVGWISLNIDQQIQARCTYDPNGSLCISTPSSLNLYECIHVAKPSINCLTSKKLSLPLLDDVDLPEATSISLPLQMQHFLKSEKLSGTQQTQLDAVVGKFADVFYSHDDNIGLCPYVEFEIELQHDKPIRCRPYRLSEPDRQFLNSQIQKWLKQGICRPSNSLYAAPAFIVDQPFQESTPRRVVVDFSRTINSITNIDPHPIDQMEDVTKRTAGKRYISKMEIKSAFNTIHIRETDIYKSGFIIPDGHFEFLRMPFGVTNGLSTMSRAIKLAYNRLAPHNVNMYIDDISTSHDNFRYPLKVLYKIFEATRNAGFKLTPAKSQFAFSEISLFGQILSQKGESPDPESTATVDRYSTLKSIQEVRSFLGFANQFRKYIRNYAVIAKPLTNSLKGLEKETSNAAIALTDDQQRSFETLKTKITSSPILAYFKQGLPTFVETDASYSGLGAVLSQDQNGKRRVIEYASRSLKYTETLYHSNELECSSVHWALTEKFRLYLLGHKFELITDNYTTAYVVAKSAINRKFARYLVHLAQFDFTTVHRPGKQNVIADHLSRFPTPSVCLTVTASHELEICAKKMRDDFCRYIFRLLKEKNPNKKTVSIIRNYNIDNNTLVRLKTNGSTPVVVIPKAMREQTLFACHNDVGHMDAKKNAL
ncbi:retrovirus-related Pol polyprotein from transposon opus [Nephila pilipes]|uniref:RNA-directed DNA polymerase n=1 Tax=Nephila pilipes TaxID=299642 RepID=A0A8X6PFR7_NEPPI|nr:retrovirus-related Pol polyprotein from transposon opus [Nephila pilipes]